MSKLAESHKQHNSEDAANRNTYSKTSLRGNPMHTPASEKELVYAPARGQKTA
jgi:hypothetical protein